MPLIAILHSPFCPLDAPTQELHYHCDLINLPRGMDVHHHEALTLIHESDCSMPVFDTQGAVLTMSLSHWRDHLHLLPGRILRPGESLYIPDSSAACHTG